MRKTNYFKKLEGAIMTDGKRGITRYNKVRRTIIAKKGYSYFTKLQKNIFRKNFMRMK